jgi:hypothetical protein
VLLASLDRAGPRPLQALWRAARDELDASVRTLSIGELLDRYGGGPRPH